jgi:hypothetical protein
MAERAVSHGRGLNTSKVKELGPAVAEAPPVGCVESGILIHAGALATAVFEALLAGPDGILGTA